MSFRQNLGTEVEAGHEDGPMLGPTGSSSYCVYRIPTQDVHGL